MVCNGTAAVLWCRIHASFEDIKNSRTWHDPHQARSSSNFAGSNQHRPLRFSLLLAGDCCASGGGSLVLLCQLSFATPQLQPDSLPGPCWHVLLFVCAGVSGGFVDCANSDGMRNPQWRRRSEWSKQLDSLNKQYFGNHSYRSDRGFCWWRNRDSVRMFGAVMHAVARPSHVGLSPCRDWGQLADRRGPSKSL